MLIYFVFECVTGIANLYACVCVFVLTLYPRSSCKSLDVAVILDCQTVSFKTPEHMHMHARTREIEGGQY